MASRLTLIAVALAACCASGAATVDPIASPTSALSDGDLHTLQAVAKQAPAAERVLDQEWQNAIRSGQKSALVDVMRAGGLPSQPASAGEEGHQLPWKTVVFISTSMPEASLRQLFGQSTGRSDILFVVRGWFPPRLNELMTQLAELVPDMNRPPSIVVHPELFRVYDVQSVPAFLHEVAPNRWKQVFGEISIPGAEEHLKARAGSSAPMLPIGRTWKVAEPDALEEIERRVALVDWDKELQKAKDRATGAQPALAVPLPSLPVALERRVRLADPTIVVFEDIRGPDGALIAAAGTRINPLDYIVLPHTVIVLDPTEPAQIAQAKRWIANAEQPAVLVTKLPATGAKALADLLGAPIYPLNSELIDRFQFTHVPARAKALGRMIEITEEPHGKY